MKTRSARSTSTRAAPSTSTPSFPVPLEILRLGPHDPEAIHWLWRNWGTTWTLRHVREIHPNPNTLKTLPRGYAVFRCSYYSADWTPWPAVTLVNHLFPDLVLTVEIDY